MADMKFVPHSSPAEAERQLLVFAATLVLRMHRDPDGTHVLTAPEEIAAVRQALALVDAPRQFVCRRHGKPFSSVDPCPACTGTRAATGFLHDSAKGEFHVALAGGRSACGESTGVRVAKVTPTANLCSRCHAVSPAAVWSTDFTEAAP